MATATSRSMGTRLRIIRAVAQAPCIHDVICRSVKALLFGRTFGRLTRCFLRGPAPL